MARRPSSQGANRTRTGVHGFPRRCLDHSAIAPRFGEGTASAAGGLPTRNSAPQPASFAKATDTVRDAEAMGWQSGAGPSGQTMSDAGSRRVGPAHRRAVSWSVGGAQCRRGIPTRSGDRLGRVGALALLVVGSVAFQLTSPTDSGTLAPASFPTRMSSTAGEMCRRTAALGSHAQFATRRAGGHRFRLHDSKRRPTFGALGLRRVHGHPQTGHENRRAVRSERNASADSLSRAANFFPSSTTAAARDRHFVRECFAVAYAKPATSPKSGP